MSFERFLLRRLLSALLLVILVSSAALWVTLAAPGDFTTEDALGQDAALIARRRAALGLDRPAGQQYVEWLGRAVRLDFGQSLLYSRPVATLVRERAVNTGLLAAAALLLATALGIPAGIYTSLRAGRAGARAVGLVSLILLSIPPLIGSLVLVMLAAWTGWLPIGGMGSAASVTRWGSWVIDLLRHLTLPAVALALPLAAVLERLQSQALRETSSERFVRAAEARGLTPVQAVLRHGWPVSLGPVLGVYGLIIGSVFSGSFIVEVITSWPGLGRLMYDALRARDLYLVAGCAAAGACCLAAGTLVADLVHAAVDPRLRTSRS